VSDEAVMEELTLVFEEAFRRLSALEDFGEMWVLRATGAIAYISSDDYYDDERYTVYCKTTLELERWFKRWGWKSRAETGIVAGFIWLSHGSDPRGLHEDFELYRG